MSRKPSVVLLLLAAIPCFLTGIDRIGVAAADTAAVVAPVGSILCFAGTTAPAGFLFCDGSEVPANATSLDAALAGAYGIGPNGRSRVPDLRGRFPLGTTADPGPGAPPLPPAIGTHPVAETGGAETHSLTAAEMPAHNHPVNDPGHFHPGMLDFISEHQCLLSPDNAATVSRVTPTLNPLNYTAVTGMSIGNTGGGAPHGIMPSFVTLRYIIATGDEAVSVAAAPGEAPTDFATLAVAPTAAGAVTVAYRLAEPSNVRWEIYDVTGRLVLAVPAELQMAGPHTFEWNGLNKDSARVASGVCLLALREDDRLRTAKVQIVR